MFKPVSSRVNFPEMEQSVLVFWKGRDVFRRASSERQDAPLYVLFEGPPTANGSPGIHHVLARVFKDVLPRYKTMKGFRVLRKGGWDTHGLPVELEIEKELGLTSKQDIERYGVEEFNQKCRESVFRYVQDWETMTDRVAFWVDLPNAYITYTNDYIESEWWALRQLWDRKLLYQGMKGAPHCPRCVTSLSSHEVALGYRENTLDPSIFVKFPVDPEWIGDDRPQSFTSLFPKGESQDVPTFFLAWTTTPWTLPGNTALAVAPDDNYALVEIEEEAGRERLILASTLVEKVIRETGRVVNSFKGRDLVGLTYRPPYDAVQSGMTLQTFTLQEVDNVPTVLLQAAEAYRHRVIPAAFITLKESSSQEGAGKDGTGVVHIAPAFGDEDLNAGRENGLAFFQPVDLQGRVVGDFPGRGKFVKDADKDIMRDLQQRGLLYHRDVYKHTYPFCWRCGTPLLYYSKMSWYIRTTAVKDRLMSGNQEINWVPDHIKEGRFGEWLRSNVDWAVSRERYWGTPIPVWTCQQCANQECIGSVEELRQRATQETAIDSSAKQLDLHRPFMDRVVLECLKCGGDMHRTPEVLDAWFDSAAMPYAQWHYPFENQTLFQDGRFPADYICEAVDQTRGWFYTLHALSTLLTGGPCYRNVICLGLILDAKGEKMSKTKGNVVDPWPILDQQGADALRWYLYTSAPPGNSRRFSASLVQESLRRFLLTLWNTYSFFVTYANIDRFNPWDVQRYWKNQVGGPSLAEVSQNEMDQWVLSELNSLVLGVSKLLDAYNPTDAARRIEDFVELLSNWYVRRSRRRFWKSESDQDKEWAYVALYTCLATLCRLIAPFVPFVAEEMYQNLVRTADPSAPESVHLDSFPEGDTELVDEGLSRSIRLAMRLSSMGRAARSKAALKVRQPLARVLVALRFPEERTAVEHVREQILEELNVKSLEVVDDEANLAEFSVKPNLAVLGPKYGKEIGKVQAALHDVDASKVVALVRAGSSVPVGDFVLEPGEVLVNVKERLGLAVTMEAGYMVAVETFVPEELQDEGLARELVHRLQGLRRDAGLKMTDRIVAYCTGGDERFRRVLNTFGEYIQQETLSQEIRNTPPEEGAHAEKHTVEGTEVFLGVHKLVE